MEFKLCLVVENHWLHQVVEETTQTDHFDPELCENFQPTEEEDSRHQ